MTRHIDTSTLRDWLEQARPVTVLDIRNDEDRGQWAIPGSVHIDVYDALRKGEPGLLQHAILPPDRPVVAVCNAGRMSEKAAEFLTKRGIDVLSLSGGMKAWSMAWKLAEQSGARLLLPAQERVRFPFSAVADGHEVSVGAATLTAMRTPGHTDESTAYLLDGVALLSGDTLFVNGVGRPDLHAAADGAHGRARVLFHSLSRLRTLPPHVLVLPAHTAVPVPFDGVAIHSRIGDVHEWLSQWLQSEDIFVERVTSRIPATPPNFSTIVELNEAAEDPDGDPADLEAGANRCAIS